MSILQLVANGLVLGAVYALVTLGFVLVVNATGAVNFAHGDLVMAGGYAAVLFGSWIKLPLLFLLPLVALAMFVLGVLVCCVAYFPLMKRPPSTVFISTLLIGVILENAYVVTMGPEVKAGPPLLQGSNLPLGPIVLSPRAIATILVAALLIGANISSSFARPLARGYALWRRTEKWPRRSAYRRSG
jgi:branched-chain amino acid transport system permease protein